MPGGEQKISHRAPVEHRGRRAARPKVRLTSLDLNSFDDERLGPLARLPITYLDLSSVDDGDLTPLIQLPLQILYIRIYSGIVPKMLREKVGKLCAPVASG